jgi:hypothetical protein
MSEVSRHDSSTDPQPQAPATQAATTNVRRRRFLMTFGAGVAGAAIAAPALAAPAALVTAPEAKPGTTGYRETDHVRSYYASARL